MRLRLQICVGETRSSFLFLVDLDRMNTVSDLIYELQQQFSFNEDAPYGILLKLDEYALVPNQSVHVLKDEDVIKIVPHPAQSLGVGANNSYSNRISNNSSNGSRSSSSSSSSASPLALLPPASEKNNLKFAITDHVRQPGAEKEKVAMKAGKTPKSKSSMPTAAAAKPVVKTVPTKITPKADASSSDDSSEVESSKAVSSPGDSTSSEKESSSYDGSSEDDSDENATAQPARGQKRKVSAEPTQETPAAKKAKSAPSAASPSVLPSMGRGRGMVAGGLPPQWGGVGLAKGGGGGLAKGGGVGLAKSGGGLAKGRHFSFDGDGALKMAPLVSPAPRGEVHADRSRRFDGESEFAPASDNLAPGLLFIGDSGQAARHHEARDEISANVDKFGQVFYAPRNLAYVGLANASAATSEFSGTRYATMTPIMTFAELVLGDVIAFQIMELDPATWSPTVSDYAEIIVTALDTASGSVDGKLNNEKKGSTAPDLVSHSFSDLIGVRLVYRRAGSSTSLPQPPKVSTPQAKASKPSQTTTSLPQPPKITTFKRTTSEAKISNNVTPKATPVTSSNAIGSLTALQPRGHLPATTPQKIAASPSISTPTSSPSSSMAAADELPSGEKAERLRLKRKQRKVRQKQYKKTELSGREFSDSVAVTLKRLSTTSSSASAVPSVQALAEELRKKREMLESQRQN